MPEKNNDDGQNQFDGGKRDFTLLREQQIVLNPDRAPFLRAKLQEYRDRLKQLMTKTPISSSALDSLFKIGMLEELLEDGTVRADGVAAEPKYKKAVRELAMDISKTKNMHPLFVLTMVGMHAFEVLKDYNDTGGTNVEGGGLPKKGMPNPQDN